MHLPFVEIMLLGLMTAVVSAALYGRTVATERLNSIEKDRKAVLQEIIRFSEDDWPTLRALLGRNIRLSLRKCGFMAGPVLLAVTPFVLGTIALVGYFPEPDYVTFGPDWIRGFEFWYTTSYMACFSIIRLVMKRR